MRLARPSLQRSEVFLVERDADLDRSTRSRTRHCPTMVAQFGSRATCGTRATCSTRASFWPASPRRERGAHFEQRVVAARRVHLAKERAIGADEDDGPR